MASAEEDPTRAHSLTTQETTCFVPGKSTGITSLIIQSIVLIVSVLVSVFFFIHVGGYEYMNWNENSTLLDIGKKMPTSPPKTIENVDESIRSILNSSLQEDLEASGLGESLMFDGANDTAETVLLDATLTSILEDAPSTTTESSGVMAFANTVLKIDIINAQLDMLELVHLSTLAYIAIAFLWLISLVFLLASIKFEVLDFVVANAIFLTIALFYAFIHALFIAVLLYYQHDVNLRTLVIVIGAVVILCLTSCVGAAALAMVIGWYRYIVYMNDSDVCMCTQFMTKLVKGRRRTPQETAQQYALSNMQSHQEIPYADEPVRTTFNAF